MVWLSAFSTCSLGTASTGKESDTRSLLKPFWRSVRHWLLRVAQAGRQRAGQRRLLALAGQHVFFEGLCAVELVQFAHDIQDAFNGVIYPLL